MREGEVSGSASGAVGVGSGSWPSRSSTGVRAGGRTESSGTSLNLKRVPHLGQVAMAALGGSLSSGTSRRYPQSGQTMFMTFLVRTDPFGGLGAGRQACLQPVGTDYLQSFLSLTVFRQFSMHGMQFSHSPFWSQKRVKACNQSSPVLGHRVTNWANLVNCSRV